MSTMNINNNDEYELSYTPTTVNQTLVLNTKNKISPRNININYSCPTKSLPDISFTPSPSYTLTKYDYTLSHSLGHWHLSASSSSNTISSSQYFDSNNWYSGDSSIKSAIAAFTKNVYYGLDYYTLASANGTWSKKTKINNTDSYKTSYNGFAVYYDNSDTANATIPTDISGSGLKFRITVSKGQLGPYGGADYYYAQTVTTLYITNINNSSTPNASKSVWYTTSDKRSGKIPSSVHFTQDMCPSECIFYIGEVNEAVDSNNINANTTGIYFTIGHNYSDGYEQRFGTDNSSYWPLDDPLVNDFHNNVILWPQGGSWHFYDVDTGTSGTCSRWVYYWTPGSSNKRLRMLNPYVI